MKAFYDRIKADIARFPAWAVWALVVALVIFACAQSEQLGESFGRAYYHLTH